MMSRSRQFLGFGPSKITKPDRVVVVYEQMTMDGYQEKARFVVSSSGTQSVHSNYVNLIAYLTVCRRYLNF